MSEQINWNGGARDECSIDGCREPAAAVVMVACRRLRSDKRPGYGQQLGSKTGRYCKQHTELTYAEVLKSVTDRGRAA